MRGPVIFLIILASVVVLIFLIFKVYQLKQFGLITRKGIFEQLDKFIIILSILGIIISLLWDFNFLKYKAPIEHKNWEKITLKDFRGLKRPAESLDGESEFAFISTSIQTKKTKNRIEIKALFHPCRSYVYNDKLYSPTLLTHELYHFHITEYFARLMRKELKKTLKKGKEIDLKKIENKILDLEQNFQARYDAETYHSYVHSEQIEWQEKIDSLLTSLKDYSKTVYNLK